MINKTLSQLEHEAAIARVLAEKQRQQEVFYRNILTRDPAPFAGVGEKVRAEGRIIWDGKGRETKRY